MLRYRSTRGLACVFAFLPIPCLAQEKPAQPDKADIAAVVKGNNEFAFDLYRQLSKDSGNLFFSPHSISNALAVVLAGAKGDTAKELAIALHAQTYEKEFHASFSRLNDRVQSAALKGKLELLNANAFWRQDGLALRPTFVEEAARNYQMEFRTADFMRNAEGARLSVNEWIEAKTKGKIKELLGAGSVNDRTRFVLVNAVYFNGKWSVAFPKAATKDESFLASFKDRVQLPTMNLTLITKYHSSDGVQMVALPYAGERLSLYAFRAESETAFRAFEARLTQRVVNDFLGAMNEHNVRLSIPKFRLEEEIALKEPLSRLGISTLFSSERADLSGISDPQNKLFVSAIIQKTYVDLNEEGTEAAAATAVVGVTPVKAGPPFRRVTMFLDRPFLFLIRDNETGAVLFLGRVMNPGDDSE